MNSDPLALMGFWLDLNQRPFVDVFPLSEVPARQAVGWELVGTDLEIPRPVTVPLDALDDNGANDVDE